MNVLGIETSCDETSASIISDGKLIANVVYTQEIHKKYGGVVPEIASQQHLNEIIDVTTNKYSHKKLFKYKHINKITDKTKDVKTLFEKFKLIIYFHNFF